MQRGPTTISCRAVALSFRAAGVAALLVAACVTLGAAGDRPPPPKLPLAEWWSVILDDGAVSAGPVTDDIRIYFAFTSGVLAARDAVDGHEVWRQKKDVSQPMAVAGEFLVTSSGDAIEALNAATGKAAWIVPRIKTVAPLLAQASWVIAVTETEVLGIRAANGEIVWRHAAGGVKLPPVLEGDRLYTGADDGRVLALNVQDGSVAWERFFPGGVTAIAAYQGRVYVGAGDKRLYCLAGSKKGDEEWAYQLGALTARHIAVDDDRVYVGSLNNVVRALDRRNGNQRWMAPLSQRPIYGAYVSGHVIFVPTAAADVFMLYDHTGVHSGSLKFPGDAPPHLSASLSDSTHGAIIYVVTGGLTNQWSLTKFAPAGDSELIPLNAWTAMPGLPYLTDPVLLPIARTLGTLVIGDPPLVPVDEVEWPIVLRDPPLVPLTVLPGLQLRPMSPTLPVRRAGRGPGG